jgi:hypothetical protein
VRSETCVLCVVVNGPLCSMYGPVSLFTRVFVCVCVFVFRLIGA